MTSKFLPENSMAHARLSFLLAAIMNAASESVKAQIFGSASGSSAGAGAAVGAGAAAACAAVESRS